jgi:hypothetical protein
MSMNESTWNTAYLIAEALVKEGIDVNELGKTQAYLRNAVNQKQSDAGERFFKYLETLTRNGRQIGHSGRTADYYRSINQACGEYLKPYKSNADTMLEILGWTSRLVRYRREGGLIGEINISDGKTNQVSLQLPKQAERQKQIAVVAESQKLKIGQVLDAIVKNIKGKEVTYELIGQIKLTVKEPKKFTELTADQKVQVEIIELRENGVPKKVKCIN